MALKKSRAKRLKISTGDDRADGATASYVRKSRIAQGKAAAAGKTDEERRLEEAVFGIDHSNSYDAFEAAEPSTNVGMDWLGQKRREKLEEMGEAGHADEDQDDEMQDVADDQLFFTDAPGPSTRPGVAESDGTASQSEMEADGDSDEEQSEPEQPQGYLSNLRGKSSLGKKPLWYDPADADVTVSLQDSSRLRKLRKTAAEDVVEAAEYENRLRQQFRKMHPTPSWAERARQAKRKGRSVSSDASDSGSEPDEEDDDASSNLAKLLQTSSAGIRRSTGTRLPLPAGELDVTRVRDANQVEKTNKSAITALQFHHSASVLFTTSDDRKLKLYQVDGSHNPLIQSVHLPELPISAAAFHPSGSSVLMTGPRPFFYSYDLQAGRVIRSPRGLWAGGLGGSDGAKNDKHGGSMELFRFSPDGRLVAVAGRRGYVHLLDWGTDGKGMMAGGNGGQVIGQIKVNTGIKGLDWNRSGTELVVTGDDAVVSSWDVGTRQCLQRWNDDGGFAPSCTTIDRSERYFGVGSHSGIVNVYDAKRAFNPDALPSAPRKPAKAIMNLTTRVTTMRFNPSSEILALASRSKADSLKLVHLPSMSVFSNWPTSKTPLGQVAAVDFSRNSEYIAIGNHKGKVLLYSLGHYAKA